MAIDSLKFLQASNPNYYSNTGVKPVNNNYQGALTTTPVVQESYKQPTVDDMERILAYQENGLNVNPFTTAPEVNETNVSAWEGFKIPPQNESHELIPEIDGREDELGLMESYFA